MKGDVMSAKKYFELVEDIRQKSQAEGQFVLGNISYFPEKMTCLKNLFAKMHYENVQTIYGLEIGTNCGHSAALFLDCLPKDSKLVSFDIGDRKYITDAADMLHLHSLGKFTFIKGDSKVTVPEYLATTPQMYDYILIDGDHTYFSVKTDLLNTVARVKPGGYIIIDDLDVPEIYRAVREYNWSLDFEKYDTNISLRYTSDKVSCCEIYRRKIKRGF